MKYQVSKRMDGYSVCFRQHRAESHCRFLHGYGISFVLHFEADDLDERNWVWDFGWAKNPHYQIDGMTVKTWFDYMFDHTVLLDQDDPELEVFENLAEKALIQLRILPRFSCECLAEFLLETIAPLIAQGSEERARLIRVDVIENDRSQGSAIL